MSEHYLSGVLWSTGGRRGSRTGRPSTGGEHAVFTPHFTGGETEVPQRLHLLSSLQEKELTFPKAKDHLHANRSKLRTFNAWQELGKCDN